MTRTDTLYERLLEENPGNLIYLEEMLRHARQMEGKLDEAREDLEFRRGLYKVQEQYLETARRERDEAREKYLKEKEELDKTLDELVEARGRIAGISGQLLCSASHVGKLEKENAKLRDIAERIFAAGVGRMKTDDWRTLRAEFDQLKEGGK